jgi:hypothetical protein
MNCGRTFMPDRLEARSRSCERNHANEKYTTIEAFSNFPFAPQKSVVPGLDFGGMVA